MRLLDPFKRNSFSKNEILGREEECQLSVFSMGVLHPTNIYKCMYVLTTEVVYNSAQSKSWRKQAYNNLKSS